MGVNMITIRVRSVCCSLYSRKAGYESEPARRFEVVNAVLVFVDVVVRRSRHLLGEN